MSFSPVLVAHVITGVVALVAGAAAMTFRKGSRRHRVSGNAFVVSMLGLAASGAYLGLMKHQGLNGLQGVLTFYLVATAWLTARRGDGEAGLLDLGGLLVPLGVGAGLAIYGLEAANSPTGLKEGFPAEAYFVFGAVALLFAGGDVRMLVRGGVSGIRRIVRHLVRMCYAMFTASASFFLGQAQVFPEALRIPALLAIPAILPLLVMSYWLWRVRFRRNDRGIAGVSSPTRAASPT